MNLLHTQECLVQKERTKMLYLDYQHPDEWPGNTLTLRYVRFLYHWVSTNLYIARSRSTALPILSQIFYQHRREDTDFSIELPLPESIVCLSVSVEEANHRSLRKRELLVCLALIVIKCSDVCHCKKNRRNKCPEVSSDLLFISNNKNVQDKNKTRKQEPHVTNSGRGFNSAKRQNYPIISQKV